MSRLAIRNIKNCSLLFCGLPIDDGLGKEPFLVFEFPEAFEYEESAEGLVVMSATNAVLTTVRLNLAEASKHNIALGEIHRNNVSEGNGAGVGPLLYKDNNSSTIIQGKVWIHKLPNWTVARRSGFVEWEARAIIDQGTIVLGSLVLEDD